MKIPEYEKMLSALVCCDLTNLEALNDFAELCIELDAYHTIAYIGMHRPSRKHIERLEIHHKLWADLQEN